MIGIITNALLKRREIGKITKIYIVMAIVFFIFIYFFKFSSNLDPVELTQTDIKIQKDAKNSTAILLFVLIFVAFFWRENIYVVQKLVPVIALIFFTLLIF